MTIVDRVKNICLTPKTEWTIIAGETASSGSLLTGYVVPLASISALAGFIGGSIVGRTQPFVGTFRVPIVTGLGVAIFTVVMAVVGVFVLSLIINALAPKFGAEQNISQARKIAVYAFTPAWVAGILQILPALSVLAWLGGLYSLYLLYLGLPTLMKCAEDKAVGYTAVIVVCAVAISLVIGAAGGMMAGGGMLATGLLNRATTGTSSTSDVQFDRNSPLGKLQELGQKLEESSKKIDAAEKSGDAGAQAAAALEGLGTLLGGGRRVDPVGIDQLKPFVPETLLGLPRTASSAERTGLAGLMVSTAKATYDDGARRNVTLEISDTGGVSGLVGLAGWVGLQGEREDDSGSERTARVNGRLTHEKTSKTGGINEFAVVLGERFVVSAQGRGVNLDELKGAVSGLKLSELEQMKDVGVKQ